MKLELKRYNIDHVHHTDLVDDEGNVLAGYHTDADNNYCMNWYQYTHTDKAKADHCLWKRGEMLLRRRITEIEACLEDNHAFYLRLRRGTYAGTWKPRWGEKGE